MESLTILVERQEAADLVLGGDERLSLSYRDDYVAEPEATPLSLSMPLGSGTAYGHDVVMPWVAGVLPDNSRVLWNWAMEFGVAPSAESPARTVFGLLRAPIGRDCAGAVQFCPPAETAELLERSGAVEQLSEADIAQRIRAFRQDAAAWLGPRNVGRFSLGGAQSKTALHFDGEHWGVPSGATPTTHILKPAIPWLPWEDLNEHLCLTAARTLGIAAAISQISMFEDETALVVERFDRVQRDGVWVRLHQEDLCQAHGVHPSRRMQTEGGPGPPRIAALLRTHAAEQDLWRFCDALAFNWIICGTDAHAKNYSVLLQGRSVELAPLYDVASVLPHALAGQRNIPLAMRIGRTYQSDRIGRAQWAGAAAAMEVDADALLDRVMNLVRRAPDAFASAAEDGAVSRINRRTGGFATRLADMIAERAAACAARLDPPSPNRTSQNLK